MTGAEVQASYFTPLHYVLYLGALFVAMVTYYEWKWANVCKNFIQVLVVQEGGGGDYQLAPKAGGELSLKNPHNNTVRTWPVNELATIDVLYPGVGFVPAFLQKTIRMAIVNEGDWEPLLNRSPHRTSVMSPDVHAFLAEFAESLNETNKKKLLKLLEGASTSPTREMIASPALFGNLLHEKVSEALLTVNREVVDKMESIKSSMSRVLSSTHFLIGIGLVVILLIFILWQVLPVLGDNADKLDAIMNSLGVENPVASAEK